LIRGQIFLLYTRAEIGKHLLNSRVGDLSCQKTLCGGVLCLMEMGTFRLFQLMQMSKEHLPECAGDHWGINK
jgi:hypothetical protein